MPEHGHQVTGEIAMAGISSGQGMPPDSPDSGLPVVVAGPESRPEIVRYGPGVPGPSPGPTPGGAPAVPTGPTVEEVWREGLPAAGQRRPQLLRRRAGTALSVILLIVSGVVIYLRLHQAPLGVTGAAITQVSNGCTVHVTGRINTTGGAGTVSYEWTFQPQLTAPLPLRQTVAAGQSDVYVSAAIEAHGKGSIAETATLRVLGPGPGRDAIAHVVISC
jgi:hypothetical protein